MQILKKCNTFPQGFYLYPPQSALLYNKNLCVSLLSLAPLQDFFPAIFSILLTLIMLSIKIEWGGIIKEERGKPLFPIRQSLSFLQLVMLSFLYKLHDRCAICGEGCLHMCTYIRVFAVWLRCEKQLPSKFAIYYLEMKFLSLVKMMLIRQICFFLLSDWSACWDH